MNNLIDEAIDQIAGMATSSDPAVNPFLVTKDNIDERIQRAKDDPANVSGVKVRLLENIKKKRNW